MARAADLAYSHIRAMILSGELASGAPMREEALADACGVSRTPVREALRRLETDLLIRRSDSQRSFVADWSMSDVEDAFSLRALLEGEATSRAASRISPADIRAMTNLNAEIDEAIAGPEPDIERFLDCNREFHAIILNAAASPRLASVLSRLVEQPVVWRTARQYDRANLARSHAEHEELLAAFRRRDPAWAQAVMAGHIRRAFHAYGDAHRGLVGGRHNETALAAE
jgi:DNA-binding GntR family transcriptional regulator